MRAYELKHKVTEDQAKLVRAEVSKFIDELLESGRLKSRWPERSAPTESI
jgi:hypothetical protein